MLVQADGSIQVMRSGGVFRPDWIRRHVAMDLQCLANDPPDPGCPVRKLDPTHFRIVRPAYKLEVQTVETRPGPQPAGLFDGTRNDKATP